MKCNPLYSSNNIKISGHDQTLHKDPKRTNPVGLARYAKEFHEAALAADDILGMKPGYEIIAPVPVLYLIGHSMELSLKAFLLHKG